MQNSCAFFVRCAARSDEDQQSEPCAQYTYVVRPTPWSSPGAHSEIRKNETHPSASTSLIFAFVLPKTTDAAPLVQTGLVGQDEPAHAHRTRARSIKSVRSSAVRSACAAHDICAEHICVSLDADSVALLNMEPMGVLVVEYAHCDRSRRSVLHITPFATVTRSFSLCVDAHLVTHSDLRIAQNRYRA